MRASLCVSVHLATFERKTSCTEDEGIGRKTKVWERGIKIRRAKKLKRARPWETSGGPRKKTWTEWVRTWMNSGGKRWKLCWRRGKTIRVQITWCLVPTVRLISSSSRVYHMCSQVFFLFLRPLTNTHTQPWPINISAIKDPTLKGVGHRRACGLTHGAGGSLDRQGYFNHWGLPCSPFSNLEHRYSSGHNDENCWCHQFQPPPPRIIYWHLRK